MMNLIDIQHDYYNKVDRMGLERAGSDTTLQTYYELHRHNKTPKQAYKRAYSGFRALIHIINN